MEEQKRDFKLDTSFDLLKTDGIRLNPKQAEDVKQDSEIEKSESRDVKSMFATANDSVKDSVNKLTQILNKNIELKKRLEEKFQLLNKEKNEVKLRAESLNSKVEFLKQKQTEFESYKIAEKKKIEMQLKEIEKGKKELEKQKQEIENNKRTIELERSKCETEKEELANNLNKFNELVGEFTIGIDKFKVEGLENI